MDPFLREFSTGIQSGAFSVDDIATLHSSDIDITREMTPEETWAILRDTVGAYALVLDGLVLGYFDLPDDRNQLFRILKKRYAVESGEVIDEDVTLKSVPEALKSDDELELEQLFLSARQGHCVLDALIHKAYIRQLRAECSDNRNTRKKANKWKKDIRHMTDLKERFYKGMKSSDIEEHICKELGYRGEITFPMSKKIIKLGKFVAHAYMSFKFINSRRDHVELTHDLQGEHVILDERAFTIKLNDAKIDESIPINMEIDKYGNRVIFAFRQRGDLFILQGYEHKFEDTELEMWFKNLTAHRLSSKYPCFNFIKAACHFPGKFIKSNRQTHSTFGSVGSREVNGWATDYRKAYASFENNEHFMGFPSLPTEWAYNPEWEGKCGWWQIECGTERLREWGIILNGAVWTTPALMFFKSLDIEFRVVFGCWTTSKLDIRFSKSMIEDKSYALAAGRCAMERAKRKTTWIDLSKLYETVAHRVIDESKGLIETIDDYEEWKSLHHIGSYIYDYAWTTILKYAIENDAFAISTDEIYTDKPVTLPGFKPSKWKNFYGDSVCIAEKYISTYRVKYTLPSKVLPNNDFNLMKGELTDMTICATGQGGSGKTFWNHAVYKWLGVDYTTLVKVLVNEKTDELEGYDWINAHKLVHPKNMWRSRSILIVDEATRLSTKILNQIFHMQKNFGFKVIFCFDPAQLGAYGDEDPLHKAKYIESMCTCHMYFTENRRALDDKLRQASRALYALSLSDKPDVNEVVNILRRFTQYDCRNETHRQIKSIRRLEFSHRGTLTVDKSQGMTIREPTYVNLNPGTGRINQYVSLVYVAISRFRRFSDVIVDIKEHSWDKDVFEKYESVKRSDYDFTREREHLEACVMPIKSMLIRNGVRNKVLVIKRKKTPIVIKKKK